MGQFNGIGIFSNIIIFAIFLFILYLVIQAAVRNGIDSSRVGKKLMEKSRNDHSDDENEK